MSSQKILRNYKPTLKEFLLQKRVRYSIPNPDGSLIAYGELCLNFDRNRFELKYSIYDVDKSKSYPLTHNGFVYNLRWLNTDSIALIKYDKDDKAQIFVYENLIGDPRQITFHPGGIHSFEVYDKGFIYSANNPSKTKGGKKLANYTHVEEEESISALYYTSIERSIEYKQRIIQQIEKEKIDLPIIEISSLLNKQYSITSFIPNSQSNEIYLEVKSKDEQQFDLDRSYFLIEANLDEILTKTIETSNRNIINTKGKITELSFPKGTSLICLSPNKKKLLFKFPERDLKQYTYNDLWILNLEEGKNELGTQNLMKFAHCISKDIDREFQDINWIDEGIIVSYLNESFGEFGLISETGELTILDMDGISFTFNSFFVSENGIMTFSGASQDTIDDIYMAKIKKHNITMVKRITNVNDLYKKWDFGTVESIKWKSKDGAEIEGVLRKPSNFNPKKKYPLIFLVHGGPSVASYNVLLSREDLFCYPTIPFVNKDILIMYVNYRGSIGKGQEFHELGVDNLGIGDMWDIESCIDYLDNQGFIDHSRIGSMGWSQGGFISAFLGMHSNRFKAVSCGASVSSWYTFYISSDIRHSVNISDNPTVNGMMEVYRKTAPISGIQNAKTPMLLQHGENDQRISVVSAKELYRSLKDKGVQTELFVYPGMGHGPNKPKQVYALLMQNYRWFMHHFFGDELDFTKSIDEE